MIKTIRVILACLPLLFACATPCHKPLEFQFEEFGFIDCGIKRIESDGVDKEYKVWCITDTDKKLIELYYLLTQ